MTDKLYVIGNGFDLHHGLNTTYLAFSNYLKLHNLSLYQSLKNYITYPDSDKDLWSNFETNLANLDVESILSDNSNYLPDCTREDFRERDRFLFPDIMEELYEEHTRKLFEHFRNFILEVKFSNKIFGFKVPIDSNSKFLTFNYTDTLERVYNISRKNILYIHNCAKEHNKLILGHGIETSKFEKVIPTPPYDLDEKEMEVWYKQNDDYDYSYDEGVSAILHYFKATFKPTKEIIMRNAIFFDCLSSIKVVYIFGHSLSGIDLPYFQKLVKSISKDTKWRVSYYKIEEKKHHLETLMRLGVEKNRIHLFALDDFQENDQQLEFSF